jgi:hypothetical protein
LVRPGGFERRTFCTGGNGDLPILRLSSQPEFFIRADFFDFDEILAMLNRQYKLGYLARRRPIGHKHIELYSLFLPKTALFKDLSFLLHDGLSFAFVVCAL